MEYGVGADLDLLHGSEGTMVRANVCPDCHGEHPRLALFRCVPPVVRVEDGVRFTHYFWCPATEDRNFMAMPGQ